MLEKLPGINPVLANVYVFSTRERKRRGLRESVVTHLLKIQF